MDGRFVRCFTLLDMTLDVFNDHDRVINDEADGEDEREQGQQVDRVAKRQQQQHHPHQRKRDRDNRNDRRAKTSEEQEDHYDDDQRGFDQRLFHLIDGRADEGGGVIGYRHVETGRQLRLDRRHRLAYGVDDGQRIAGRCRIDADEYRFQPIEYRRAVGVLRSKFDLGDIA